MSDLAQSTHVAIEPEPPELQQRNLWVGARLLVSSTIFLFLPFVFAFVYLASLDNGGMWRPQGVEAPTGWGIAILACVVAAAGLVAWARSELGNGRDGTSRLLLFLSLLAGIGGDEWITNSAAVAVGAYSRLAFGPDATTDTV